MTRLKVLMLTRLFPSREFPTLGTFCLERAVALADHVDLRVMVPTPWFPAWIRGPQKWRRYGRVERRGEPASGVHATYPRYLSIPAVATWSQGLAVAVAVRRELKTYGGWMPDVIDGHFAFPDGYAAVALARSLGRPATVTCHGSDLRLYPALKVTGSMVRSTLVTADRVISVSSDLMRRSVSLGCPQARAVFLTNGVDPAKFAVQDKAHCRRKLGLPLDRHIGVCVGFLIDRKDQSLIVKATAEIVRRGLQPPLVVLVGDGPNRERLQNEVVALGVSEHVLMVGQRPHAEVADWMGAADWLVLTSESEGWATVYFEAMACGRPVLTSNVSSAMDAVGKPEFGRVVEPRTAQAFANAMVAAAEREFEPSVLRTYAEAHSWSQWSDQARALFDQVVAERAAAASLQALR